MNTFNPEYTVGKMREELRSYLTNSGLKSLVVGISGGVDSALAAALVYPVCQELSIPLIGRFIHIESNKPEESNRANEVGRAFCSDYKSVDLTDLYITTRQSIEEDTAAKLGDLSCRIRFGNVKARLRMIYLYNLAQKHCGLVLSTDNHTEIMLGYWTLHGDVGDYAMFANLWKTEVYQCSKWLIENDLTFLEQQHALEVCVDAVPTDGLGTTSSDLEQLKANSYAEVDELLQKYLSGSRDQQLLEHPVIQRHLRSEFKRNNPYNVPRERIC